MLMKKKLVISFIILSITLICTSIIAYANYTNQTVFTIHENGVICSLKTYDSSASGKVEIPKDYNGIIVTEICENAFLKCKNVTEIIVPKTVVNIGDFSMGYVENEKGEKVKNENFIIWGRAGSEAEKYAKKNGITFKVFLTTPSLLSAKNAVNGVKVSWSPTDNAAGYNIYRKTAKSNWEKIAYVKGESKNAFADKTPKNATTYFYSVSAVHGDFSSDYNKKGVSVYHITAPTVTISNTKSGVKISWKKNNKATSYKIYKKLEGASSWTGLKTTKNDVFSYTDTTAKNNEKAYYCVKAVINKNVSGCDTKKINIFLSEPKITSVKNVADGIRVYWNKISGAKNYKIYRRLSGEKWVALKDVSANTTAFTDKTAKSGTNYIYTVKAVNGKFKSSHSKGLAAYCVNTPTLKSAKTSGKALSVSWSKVKHADYYVVYRKTADTSWARIYKTKDNKTLSYKDTNVASGNNYIYTVKAFYKNTSSGHNSKGLNCTYFASPVLNSVRCIKSKNIVLNWSKVGGASYYTIYKKVIDGKYSVLATVNSDTLTFTDSNIAIGKEYAYKIKATSTSGIVSGYSNAKTARVLDPKKPMVALTYDDGPSKNATTRILNVLEKYNSRATFFVVGSRIDSYKSQLKRTYNLKCEIGNHTYNHKTLTTLSATGVKKELNDTSKKIKAVTGENPVLMRPPGGSYNNNTVKSNTAYPIIMWSVDTRDWESRNSTKIVSHIKSNVRNGSIILMHDLYDSTASATETIVPWLIKNGYQLVTVSELMDAKGVTMKNGVAYSSAK